MRILKVKQNGDVGAVIVNASHFVVKPALSDEFCVCFEAQGYDNKMDRLDIRIVMTRNELRTLNQFADLSRGVK